MRAYIDLLCRTNTSTHNTDVNTVCAYIDLLHRTNTSYDKHNTDVNAVHAYIDLYLGQT